MSPFTEKVIKIIRNIPEGKVMTYGQIATLAGSPRGARQVVRILHTMSHKYQLPWHRVINSKGEIGFRDEENSDIQRTLLEQEGVQFTDQQRINLQIYIFDPQ